MADKRIVSGRLGDYHVVRGIGKGSYGEVFLVKHRKDKKSTPKMHVMKTLKMIGLSEKNRTAAEQEAILLSRLQHPNIVSYRESFQDELGALHIVMQYCEGGDMCSRLKSQKGVFLPEDQVIEWFVQIALALQYLHQNKILHRDLKTQNIFLTKADIIKVGDLGIARVLDNTSDLAHTLIGTPYYMSPEIFKDQPYNQKSDIWSLGCCVYEMATLKHAFVAKGIRALMALVVSGKLPEMPKHYSGDLGRLIRVMLAHKAENRPSVQDILRLPYVKHHIKVFLEKASQKQVRKASTNSRKSKLQSQTPVLEDGDVSGKDSERNVLSREVKCSGQCSSDDKCCDAVSEQNIETDQTSKQEHHNSAASNEHAQTLTAVSQISKSDASEDNLHSNHHCLPAEKILNQLGSASDSVLTSPLRPSNGKQKINSTSDGSDHLNRSSSAPSLREELQSHKVGVEFTDGLPVSNPILQSPALKQEEGSSLSSARQRRKKQKRQGKWQGPRIILKSKLSSDSGTPVESPVSPRVLDSGTPVESPVSPRDLDSGTPVESPISPRDLNSGAPVESPISPRQLRQCISESSLPLVNVITVDGNLIIEQDASKPSGCHDNKGVDKEPDRLSPSPAVSNLSSSSSSEKCMDNVESSETVDEEMSSMLTILDATLHLPPPEQFRESTAEPKEAFLQDEAVVNPRSRLEGHIALLKCELVSVLGQELFVEAYKLTDPELDGEAETQDCLLNLLGKQYYDDYYEKLQQLKLYDMHHVGHYN